jgi:four helix bundle protein
MKVKSYQDLIVWQKGMDLVESVYRVTRVFPKEEMFGLTSQVRRAAVSVPSNLAEGQGRQTTRDFMNFISIARGSLQEMETQILIASRLQYIIATQTNEITDMVAEVGRLLSGLYNSLNRK